MRSLGLALISLALAAPASATVVLDESGVFDSYTYFPLDWGFYDPAKRYRLSLAASAPVFASAVLESGFCYEEYGPGGELEWQFCDDFDQNIGLGEGSRVTRTFATFGYRYGSAPCFGDHLCVNWDWQQLAVVQLDTASRGVSYRLRLVESAVPEPAAWALMIAGFGLVGGSLRRRAKGALRPQAAAS